jgi:hypothetical protein
MELLCSEEMDALGVITSNSICQINMSISCSAEHSLTVGSTDLFHVTEFIATCEHGQSGFRGYKICPFGQEAIP